MSNEPKVTRFGADPTLTQELATKAYVDAIESGNTFARVVKKVDEVKNSDTTFADDTEIFFTGRANRTYHWIFLWESFINSTADMKIRWTDPAGASGNAVSNAQDWDMNGTIIRSATSTIVLSGNNQVRFYEDHGTFLMGATAGDINFQWAQNVSNAGDVSILRGSLLVVWEDLD